MQYLIYILALVFGVFVQSVSGFGAPLLAMPVGIMLLGMDTVKPSVSVISFVAGGIVVLTQYKYINVKELIRMVAVMLVGVFGGMWVSGNVSLKILAVVYSVLVILIGLKKLCFPSKRHPSVLLQNASLGIAGIMQGLFVSGGSFLAVYAMEKIPEKREFRATVNTVWVIINFIMVITHALTNNFSLDSLKLTGISLLPALLAVWLGSRLIGKINQKVFLTIVYLTIILSGAVLLCTNIF